MKTPIIVVTSRGPYVVPEFDGVFVGTFVQTLHNLTNNTTQFVIDSNGDLLSLDFDHTNHSGIRRIFSYLIRNISYDRYTYKKEPDISVQRFRDVIGPHQNASNPDRREMAIGLIEPIAGCEPTDPLRSHITLLNL